MTGIIQSKDEVIVKKERLIQEYKADIEKERREKADIMKKVKELQQAVDENKYLLQQKGDSQTEASRKLEQFAQSLSSKQKEIEEKNLEIQQL